MSTVYTYVLETGVITPEASNIQAEVIAEYQSVFGMDLSTAPNTPQGLLINAETQARIAAASNNATLANQINPNFAGGVFLDAILALLGSQRLAATYSTVLCTLTGVIGTSIPAGSLAQDTNGNQWSLSSTVIIPTGGSYTGASFTSVLPGAIIVDANDLNTIISNVLGWETITNPYTSSNPLYGSIGTLTQSDVSARQYRLNTLYLQSNGLAGSIIAALSATTSVNSLYFIENPSSSPTTIQGVAMNANSIYCCIDGTNQEAIAATLTATKSAGCAYTNGASQTPISKDYTVPLSGQVIDVLWDAPDIISIGVEITVYLYTPVQDYVTTVTNAILNYAAGGVNGLQGLVVGHDVSPFEISAAVGIQYPGVYVINCLISNLTQVIQPGVLNGTSTVTGLTNATTLLYPGMGVTGTYIPASTTILSITNDTTIILSANATNSGTETLTFAGVYEAASIDIDPWQLAQITSTNIRVSLATRI
jgi:hypothetical protein